MVPITSIVIAVIALVIAATACANNDSMPLAPPSPDHHATPNRAQPIVVDKDAPPNIISRDAERYYRDGIQHMRNAERFSAVAAYSEVIHMHPRAASAYAARGTAHLYGRDHQHAIKDYTTAIKNAPDHASYWRRRAHAWSTADPPQPQKAIDDATRAIELNPNHHMSYGHRAIANTLLSNPRLARRFGGYGPVNLPCIPNTTARLTSSAPGSTRTSATMPPPNAIGSSPSNNQPKKASNPPDRVQTINHPELMTPSRRRDPTATAIIEQSPTNDDRPAAPDQRGGRLFCLLTGQARPKTRPLSTS